MYTLNHTHNVTKRFLNIYTYAGSNCLMTIENVYLRYNVYYRRKYYQKLVEKKNPYNISCEYYMPSLNQNALYEHIKMFNVPILIIHT